MEGANPFHHTSAHRDVLDAPVPHDSVSRTVLLNELKNRGKGAVLAQQWYDADLLYQKAIDVAKACEDVKEEAILRSNLSLCQGKMNGWQAAYDAASMATTLDPLYVKGWWRLGQACAALEKYEESIKAFEKALFYEPKNKAIPKELQKVKQQQQAAKTKAPTSTTSKTTTTTTSTKTTTTTSSTTSSKPKTTTSSSSNKPEPMDIDDSATTKDSDGFSKSDIVRGYKIVNGKKTSYFHNELDENTKKLIGDIAPKRLDETTSSNNVSPTTESGNNKVASAWNKAGTWEERDITAWTCDALSKQLKSTAHQFGGDKVAVVDKADVTGSASIALVRGKKRYIYELCIKLDFKVKEIDTDDILASGSFSFPDVDGTCMVGEPYEATDFKVDSAKSQLSRTELNSVVFNHGLRDELHKSIDAWVQLLQETY